MMNNILAEYERAQKELEKLRPKNAMDVILITKWAPIDDAYYRAEYKGKVYALIQRSLFTRLTAEVPVIETTLTGALLGGFYGVPIIEDDVLAAEIIFYLLKPVNKMEADDEQQ